MIEEERDIDLFAGPGGWDEGVAGLGVRPLGIEWDDAACATRRARGHETLQADVAGLDPQEFAPVRLMIASPPCQAFSMAGLGHARKALAAYVRAIRKLMEEGWIDRESLDKACEDPRGHLVLEPLRWAIQIRPRFIACEQVEPVLPLWEEMATALRELGYGTWTGILSAECYGVPQTRRRAFLLAKLDGQVTPPPRTHQRYIAPRAKAKQEESLFDAPEPERIVAPEDRELRPWISMAEALGWNAADRRTSPSAQAQTSAARRDAHASRLRTPRRCSGIRTIKSASRGAMISTRTRSIASGISDQRASWRLRSRRRRARRSGCARTLKRTRASGRPMSLRRRSRAGMTRLIGCGCRVRSGSQVRVVSVSLAASMSRRTRSGRERGAAIRVWGAHRACSG